MSERNLERTLRAMDEIEELRTDFIEKVFEKLKIDAWNYYALELAENFDERLRVAKDWLVKFNEIYDMDYAFGDFDELSRLLMSLVEQWCTSDALDRALEKMVEGADRVVRNSQGSAKDLSGLWVDHIYTSLPYTYIVRGEMNKLNQNVVTLEIFFEAPDFAGHTETVDFKRTFKV
jgi:hypothetical protein